MDTASPAAQGAGAGMSTPTPLVVVGGGEHARVIVDCARSRPDRWRVVGYADQAESAETTARFGIPWLGSDDAAIARAPADACFVLGVGGLGPSPRRRESVARLGAAAPSLRWATLVHARAVVADTALLAEGVVVFAGSVINTGAVVGAHAVVNTGAVVEHDVRVGAFAFLGPGAVIGGGVAVGEGAFLGLGCRVRDHVAVGAGALVGMGAVVVADVPDGAVAVGVPARVRLP